jgi:hypothetical protein
MTDLQEMSLMVQEGNFRAVERSGAAYAGGLARRTISRRHP